MRRTMQQVRVAAVGILVLVGGLNFLGAQNGRAGAEVWPALVASSEAADRAGIRTYRVEKPEATAAGVVTRATLIGARATEVGSFEWRRSANGGTQSLSLGGQSVVLMQEGSAMRLTVNGVERFAGEVTPQKSNPFDAETERLLRLMSAIHADLIAYTRDASFAGREMAREAAKVAWLPSALRPVALAIDRYLPVDIGVTVYAAGHDEITCTGSQQCDWGFGSVRTVACNQAWEDAKYECTNGWCIGCCENLNPDCDCACLYDDLVCSCLSCGRACRGPI